MVGPNGAGKSTTLLTIAGELAPHAGAILFEGRPLTALATETVVRRGVSLVPEGRRIFGRLTVDENLRLATFIRRDARAAAADLERILERFPLLGERLHAPAGRLSGGEQQILAICRALLARPKLMLVDEPALGLAPLMVDTVYETLTGLREEGMTLLLVEQSLERALGRRRPALRAARRPRATVGRRGRAHRRRAPGGGLFRLRGGRGRRVTFALQVVINAVSIGSLYALAALGIGLLFGVMRLINFAHANYITIGAYAIIVPSTAAMATLYIGTWHWALMTAAVCLIVVVLAAH